MQTTNGTAESKLPIRPNNLSEITSPKKPYINDDNAQPNVDIVVSSPSNTPLD